MLDRSGEATRVVEILGLAPHPEGGHFRETYRAPAPAGPRSAMSLIYYAAGGGRRGRRQSARSFGAWTLVACAVSPAFVFGGFEMAPLGFEPAPIEAD